MNIKENGNRLNQNIDFIGLGSAGIVCFLYSLFWSNFAELHIALPFLDFPIFVGEILLFWCIVLLALKWKTAGFKFDRKYWLLVLYGVWVLYKAAHGYFEWGPLALRNAALFYYPFFAFAGYHFYRKDFFNQKVIYMLFIILAAAKIAAGASFIYYFSTPYLMLSIFLILKMQVKKIRYLAFATLIYSFSFKDFFDGSRSFLIANFAVLLFLFFAYVFGVLKIRRIIKISGLISFLLVLILIFFKFAPSEKVKSLTTPQYVIEQFQAYDELIRENMKSYVPREIPVRIYNPNKSQVGLDNVDEEKRISHEIKSKVNVLMEAIKVEADPGGPKLVALNEQEKVEPATSDKAPVIAGATEHKIMEAIKVEADPGGPKLVALNEQEKVELVTSKKASVVAGATEHKIDESGINLDDKKRQKVESDREESMYFRMFQKQKEQVRREVLALDEANQRKMIYFDEEFGSAVNEAVENLVQGKEVIDGTRRGRGMQTEYGNILFRILIWREMLEELIKEKRWFGFSFGKPQRSISLESSGFAAGEWGRDGWIAPHNAFLHIIYRAGVLGVLMLFGILVFLFFMVSTAVKRRSMEGLLLLSILIYWLVLSNFLVVLELPYQAIPFWTLFGMIFAYLYKEKDGLERI